MTRSVPVGGGKPEELTLSDVTADAVAEAEYRAFRRFVDSGEMARCLEVLSNDCVMVDRVSPTPRGPERMRGKKQRRGRAWK